MEENAVMNTAITKVNAGDRAIAKINDLVSTGFSLPVGYNHVNAIKSSIMTLSEMRDRDGKLVLDTCTGSSIYGALLDMAQRGLDVSKGQGYFCKRGDKLTFQKEYHGTTTLIQRLFPNYTPVPRVIYTGDEFEYETDPQTGRRRLLKHVQKIENMDNEFVGAYLYIPCRDGGMDLYTMTRKMIMEAWAQSSNKSLSVHKRFVDKMVCKTIINSALQPLVSSSDSMQDSHVIVNESPYDAPEDIDCQEIEPEYVPVEEMPIEEVSE